MGADHIFAEPGTLTGSIGVFGGKMNLSGFYEEWLKVSHHTYKRGEQATLFSSMSDFNDSERAVFRSFLQGFYTTFVTKAAEGRSMSYEDLHAVAQGRVWNGEQALERNLIDELGSTNDASSMKWQTQRPLLPSLLSFQRVSGRDSLTPRCWRPCSVRGVQW